MLLRGAEDPPLLDLAVLAELVEDLGSPDIAWNFAQDYIQIWQRRRDALAAALERGERSAALDAVISLRISAAMIGGLRLAHLAQTLHASYIRGTWSGACRSFPELMTTEPPPSTKSSSSIW